MIDYKPKVPLTFGISPLTNIVYAMRGNKREDISEEFDKFAGDSIRARDARIAALEAELAEAKAAMRVAGENETTLLELIASYQDDLTVEREKVARLVEALAFYADPHHYVRDWGSISDVSEAEIDNGTKARAAIDAAKG